jgi:uncharacterized membrane protein YeaQ/YmgE (transglycosylase-associated protein family)
MHLFAEMGVTPSSFAAWVAAGLAAAVLAGWAIGAPGYGVARELVAGVAGAVAGGLLFAVAAPDRADLYAGTVIAFVGAGVVIAAARLVTRRAPSG